MRMPVILALSLSLTGMAFTPEKGSTDQQVQQQTCSFTSLHGHRQGNGIMLMWNMNNTQLVTQYRIEGTYEDPIDPYSVWINKGTVQNHRNGMQQFTESSVLPGTMYYRIYARLNNGTVIGSDICTIRIVRR